MRTRNRIAVYLSGAAVVVALIVGGIVGWAIKQREEHPLARPEFYVPASYRDVRHSPGHSAHVGVEGVECVDCHEPTDGGIGEVSLTNCTQSECHDDLSDGIHASFFEHQEGQPPRDVEPPKCLGCHRFTEEDDYAAKDCMRCHVEPLGETAAVVRHHDTECLLCHKPHDPEQTLEPANCLECHERHETAHGKVDSPEGCLTCHRAHPEFMLASDRCVECHGGQQAGQEGPTISVRTATFEGHTACTTCHAQPEGGGVARRCTDCHHDRQVIAQGVAAPHRECTSCHRPHAARARASGACRRCHGDVRSDHPPAARGDSCTGCHPAHPDNAAMVASGGAVACTSCHRVAPSDAQAHAGEQQCQQCHQPHRFRVRPTPQFCGNCHQTQVELVSRQSGHAQCTNCHEAAPHHPSQPTANCGQCHTVERATAPGGHRRCTVCHLPHDGNLRPRATQCQSCHQRQGAQAQTHSGQQCSNCHRPHGPFGIPHPPGCTSCHSRSDLPGLHNIDQHDDCMDCHSPHETGPRRGRDNCVTCHEDKADHQPDADVCTGCHVFKEG